MFERSEGLQSEAGYQLGIEVIIARDGVTKSEIATLPGRKVGAPIVVHQPRKDRATLRFEVCWPFPAHDVSEGNQGSVQGNDRRGHLRIVYGGPWISVWIDGVFAADERSVATIPIGVFLAESRAPDSAG